MILGLTTHAFTLLHVVISLIAIAAGFLFLFGLIGGRLHTALTSIFLISTALTSLTGFAFPNSTITPGIIVGILSMVVLSLAVLALYAFHLAGAWRRIFVIAAGLALYFNCFVLVAQLFEHVPALHSLDPTQSGAPFGLSQLAVLLLFIWLTFAATKKFNNFVTAPQ